MKKYFYVTHDGLMSPVFDSQVINLVRFIASWMGSITLVTFERDPNCYEIRRKANLISSKFRGKFIVLSKPPFISTSSIRPLSDALAKIISQDASRDASVILHCRGQIGAYIGAGAKRCLPAHRIKVIADIRGLPAEEMLHKCRLHPQIKDIILLPVRYKALKNIEKFAYFYSDFLSCISHGLKDYISTGFSVPSAKIEIVPCSVDINTFTPDENGRRQVRQMLHLQDKIVFTYCGSLETWQRLDKVIEFFKIAKYLCSDIHLLLLIRVDRNKINRLLAKYNIDKSHVSLLSLEHREVTKFIRAGDVGVIFRENNLLNSVSFPTKFGEYLASGLFVITTTGAREVARIVNSDVNMGHVLKSFPKFDLKEIGSIISLLRSSEILTREKRAYRHDVAKATISTDIQYLKYKEIYKRLIND